VTVSVAPAEVERTAVLDVRGLRKQFWVRGPGLRRVPLHAVNGVSFSIGRGETLALVGESGCGKTTVGRCIVRLLEPDDGQITIDGEDVTHLPQRALAPLRGRFQMVFQDPSDSLNPRLTVEDMVGEPLDLHSRITPQKRRARVAEVLGLVGLKEEHLDRLPHQLSIGQQQRVGVARAIITGPKFLVLDEPTSALDVSVRGMVVSLLKDLRDELHLSYLFVSHDLSVVKQISDRVAVMYLGMIVELGPTNKIFTNPMHPYTKALLSAVPIPDPLARRERIILQGEVPSPIHLPSGCYFHTRCPIRQPSCDSVPQVLTQVGPGHWVACHVVA
jgi:oligopeptide/dipeptide ABC transporter ATP-binding protein